MKYKELVFVNKNNMKYEAIKKLMNTMSLESTGTEIIIISVCIYSIQGTFFCYKTMGSTGDTW